MTPFSELEYDKQWLLGFIARTTPTEITSMVVPNGGQEPKLKFDFAPLFSNFCDKTIEAMTPSNYDEKMNHMSDLTNELIEEGLIMKGSNFTMFLTEDGKNLFKMEFKHLASILPKINFEQKWNMFLDQENSKYRKLSQILLEDEDYLAEAGNEDDEEGETPSVLLNFKHHIMTVLLGSDIQSFFENIMEDTTLTMNFIKFFSALLGMG